MNRGFLIRTRRLKHVRYFFKNAPEVEITDGRTLKLAIDNDNVYVKPAEVVGNYSNFKKFGINVGDTIEDVVMVKVIKNDEITEIDIRDIYDEAVRNNIDPKNALREFFYENIETLKETSSNEFVNRLLSEDVPEKIANNLATYYDSL